MGKKIGQLRVELLFLRFCLGSFLRDGLRLPKLWRRHERVQLTLQPFKLAL
jgi:hypothetical protein